MRQIKFRAWDAVNEKMLVGFTVSLEQGRLIALDFENKERLQLIESTGLHDIDGVEIFEGHVLGPQDKKSNRFLVYWDTSDASFTFKGDCGGRYSMDLMENTDLRIIGNRFENPELLADTEASK